LRHPSLKHRIGISCRSLELESFGDCCFLTARRVGHGAGRSGTHEHRIWRGRYRRACDRGFHGRLRLCLPRGSSGQRGREAPKTPAGGEGRTAQAARPDGGLVRLYSRKDGSSNSIGIAKLSRCAKRAAWPHPRCTPEDVRTMTTARPDLLARLTAGPVICAEGFLFELERRGLAR
jgi:hypothetical protein